MIDPSQLLAGPSPAQMQVPSAANPGGMPQGLGDPLAEGFDLVIVGIKQLAKEANLNNDEALSAELETMASRLVKRKLARKKAIESVNDKVAIASTSAQL